MPLFDLITLPADERFAREMRRTFTAMNPFSHDLYIQPNQNSARADLVNRVRSWDGTSESTWLRVDVRVMRQLLATYGNVLTARGADEQTLTRLAYLVTILDNVLSEPDAVRPWWLTFAEDADPDVVFAREPHVGNACLVVPAKERITLTAVLVQLTTEPELLDALRLSHVDAEHLRHVRETMPEYIFGEDTVLEPPAGAYDALRRALDPDAWQTLDGVFAPNVSRDMFARLTRLLHPRDTITTN